MTNSWDQDQASLEVRAQRLLDQLALRAELERLGEPILTGSAALHLMVARDIDLTVVLPGLEAVLEQVTALGARLGRRPDVQETLFRNDTGRWNQDESYPDGLYLHIKCTDDLGDVWTLDVWFVDKPHRQPDLQHLESVGRRITPDSQAQILAIKRSTGGRWPDGSRLASYEIYRAVLDQDNDALSRMVATQ